MPVAPLYAMGGHWMPRPRQIRHGRPACVNGAPRHIEMTKQKQNDLGIDIGVEQLEARLPDGHSVHLDPGSSGTALDPVPAGYVYCWGNWSPDRIAGSLLRFHLVIVRWTVPDPMNCRPGWDRRVANQRSHGDRPIRKACRKGSARRPAETACGEARRGGRTEASWRTPAEKADGEAC